MTKKILLVDDSKLSRMMIKAIIEDHRKNWEVIEAANGDDAIAKVSEQDFDLATIDLNMPGMDGLELADKLKASHPGARYALLTANIQDVVKDRAEALGLEFIGKPITEDKIVRFISD